MVLTSARPPPRPSQSHASARAMPKSSTTPSHPLPRSAASVGQAHPPTATPLLRSPGGQQSEVRTPSPSYFGHVADPASDPRESGGGLKVSDGSASARPTREKTPRARGDAAADASSHRSPPHPRRASSPSERPRRTCSPSRPTPNTRPSRSMPRPAGASAWGRGTCHTSHRRPAPTHGPDPIESRPRSRRRPPSRSRARRMPTRAMWERQRRARPRSLTSTSRAASPRCRWASPTPPWSGT